MFQKNCRDLLSYLFRFASFDASLLCTHLLLFNFQGPSLVVFATWLLYHIPLDLSRAFEKVFEKLFSRCRRSLFSSVTAYIFYHIRRHLSRVLCNFFHFWLISTSLPTNYAPPIVYISQPPIRFSTDNTNPGRFPPPQPRYISNRDISFAVIIDFVPVIWYNVFIVLSRTKYTERRYNIIYGE